jgi:hypothetical protein
MGIFDTDTFTTYHARIVFRDRLMGGIPMNPKIIEGWLRSKAGIEAEEEIRRAMLRTLLELGADVSPDMTFEELERASEGLAAQRQTNGFKVDEGGLYIESRQVKAMLKESANILYPYTGPKWGMVQKTTTKKGVTETRDTGGKSAKSFIAERVFVSPDRLHVGRPDPDGIELFIGHVTGPSGPQSTLTYHQYVERAVIEFDVMVCRNEVKAEHWPEIWVHAQENGIGALRSQGFGRFDIEQWERSPLALTA